MGDSDDEYDRGRSRDKFRRERSDYENNEKGRSGRSDSYRDKRATWRDDRRRSREEYDNDRRRYSSGFGRGPGGSGGRDWSPPPAKRMRKDWDSLRDYSGPGMMTPYGMRPPWAMGPPGPHPQVPPMVPGIPRESPNSTPQGPTRHMMLSFKQFLTQQDDSIDESDAITSYSNYKNEFKKKQMEEFFEKHKDEDWFMSLYHPTKLAASKEEAAAHLQSRVKAFRFILENGYLDQVSLSVDHTQEIIKIMDTAVIMMEGGTDQDLSSLEEEAENEGEVDDEKADKQQPSFMLDPTEEDIELAEKAKQYGMKKLGRKRKRSEEVEEESGGSSSEDSKEMEESKKVSSDSSPLAADSAISNGTGETEQKDTEGVPSPRSLHLTHSVYIRHIPPKISSEDIVKVCKNIPGFLRIAFAEPTPDKSYERRGWVTFSHGTDIKEVVGKLGSTKVKDCLLVCTTNRDLSRRVKHTSPAAWARKAVHSDLQLALKLVRFLDKKHQLWENAPKEDEEKEIETNPILGIDESQLSEEEEPVSMAVGGEDEEGAISDSSTDVLEESNTKLKVFEKLHWYLRLVHSLDFYNASFFPSEDNMPHRCGIFTVRKEPPETITPEELSQYCEDMEKKMQPLLIMKEKLSDSEVEKFGMKDPEVEAKEFIEANTQKISEHKYLCPLSGKKFKGPEFVKKHIFNKHMDKVEAVKKEAEFFNNYLRDPERPMPLENSIKTLVLPPNPKTPSAEESPSLGMISPMAVPPLPGAGSAWAQDSQMMHILGRGAGGYGGMRFPGMGDRGQRGSRRGRGRRRVEYFDLDAPEEIY